MRPSPYLFISVLLATLLLIVVLIMNHSLNPFSGSASIVANIDSNIAEAINSIADELKEETTRVRRKESKIQNKVRGKRRRPSTLWEAVTSLKEEGLLPAHYDPDNTPYIWYNRVPKCGSTTALSVIKSLRQQNNFRVITAGDYHTPHIKPEDIVELYEKVTKHNPPLLAERHLHFVDFASVQGLSQPWYINIIRDPFDRMVSWYYFRRKGTRMRNEGLGTDQKNQTFDECVLRNSPECTEPNGESFEKGYFKIIPYFCGQEDFCRKPGTQSLALAKKNVEKYYLLVGTTDQLPEFFAVLEKILPKYFKGAYRASIQDEKSGGSRIRKKTPFKVAPKSEEARRIMKDKLRYEYDFYYFVRSRFARICDTLGIQHNVNITHAP